MGYSNSRKGKINALEQEQYIAKYIRLVNSRPYIKGIWWYQLINEKNTTEYESNLGLLNSDLSEKKYYERLHLEIVDFIIVLNS